MTDVAYTYGVPRGLPQPSPVAVPGNDILLEDGITPLVLEDDQTEILLEAQ